MSYSSDDMNKIISQYNAKHYLKTINRENSWWRLEQLLDYEISHKHRQKVIHHLISLIEDKRREFTDY